MRPHAFPRPSGRVPVLFERLVAVGIALRPASEDDLPFLRDLYAGLRAAELLLVPWPPAQKRAFLDDQFRLQHLHFTRVHPRCDFWVVEQANALALPRAIGRLYLDRSAAWWRIVDIGLLAEVRGQGLGGALLGWVQAQAAGMVTDVRLSVAANAPRARSLYLRIGFVDGGAPVDNHQPMIWRCPD